MRQSKITLTMDISKPMIEDEELDRILENTILDEFELTDLPQELLDGSLQEEPAVRSLPPCIQTVCQGWHPEKGVIRNCAWELTIARDLLCHPA